MPWISRKRKSELEEAAKASGWGGEAPWLSTGPDGRYTLTWPEHAKFVLVSRSLLEKMIRDLNATKERP